MDALQHRSAKKSPAGSASGIRGTTREWLTRWDRCRTIFDGDVALTVGLGCRFTVDPDVGNEGGVAFWKAIGFVPTGVISDDERGPYWLMEWPTS